MITAARGAINGLMARGLGKTYAGVSIAARQRSQLARGASLALPQARCSKVAPAFARACPWLDRGAGTAARGPRRRCPARARPGRDRRKCAGAWRLGWGRPGVGAARHEMGARVLAGILRLERAASVRAAGADAVTGLRGAPMPCSAASGHGLRVSLHPGPCQHRRHQAKRRRRCRANGKSLCAESAAMSDSPDRSTGVPRARELWRKQGASAGPVSRSAGTITPLCFVS
jgi:hypothetical protein